MISLFSRIPPMTLIVLMLAAGTVFIGYNITATNIHNSDTEKINEQTRKLLEFAIDQNFDAITQNDNIEKILQQQGNLTTANRERLIVALNDTIELVPEVKRQTAQMLNATNEMYNFTRFISESFDEEYLIDEVRQYGQSNSTQVKLDQIIELLNGTGTLVPINNTDREITPG
jgi:hypothetical protein